MEARKDGAIDYTAKPFAPEVLLNMVSRYAPVKSDDNGDAVVADEKSLKLLALADKVAKTDANVMVLGPSGSGKEVMSRYIHNASLRKDGPFVAINCAATPLLILCSLPLPLSHSSNSSSSSSSVSCSFS